MSLVFHVGAALWLIAGPGNGYRNNLEGLPIFLLIFAPLGIKAGASSSSSATLKTIWLRSYSRFFKWSYFLSLSEVCLLQLLHLLSSMKAKYCPWERIFTFLMLNCKDINLEFFYFCLLEKKFWLLTLKFLLYLSIILEFSPRLKKHIFYLKNSTAFFWVQEFWEEWIYLRSEKTNI